MDFCDLLSKFLKVISVIFFIIFLILLVISLFDLSSSSQDDISSDGQIDEIISVNKFEIIYDSDDYKIFRHKLTDVLYIFYNGYRKGGLSVMYNSEGKPLTYKEYQELSEELVSS